MFSELNLLASLDKNDIAVAPGPIADSLSLIKCRWLTSESEDRTRPSPNDLTTVAELGSRVGQG